MEDELLAFPPENNEIPPLTGEELVIVRKMISEYNQKNSFLPSDNVEVKPNIEGNNLFQSQEPVPVKPAVTNLFSDEPVMPPSNPGLLFSDDSSTDNESEASFDELLDSCKGYDSSESYLLNDFKEILSKTQKNVEKTLITAFLGVFPCKRFIRHGTPEQKLFFLKVIGDRFLENIAGLKFTERKKLLKLVAKYLSDVSENYTFIPMEGEPFKPMFHERVEGSSSSGLIVKEMRSFLIVDSGSNRIIYTGLVLS